MRIDAVIGPVTLIFERATQPRPGERFKVAVFVADKAMGVAHVTYEEWVAFCQASPVMKSAPTPPKDNAFEDYRTFDVTCIGTAHGAGVVTIDVPIDFFIEDEAVRARLTDEQLCSLARTYVHNLASDDGITIDWDLDPVEFVDVSEVKLR